MRRLILRIALIVAVLGALCILLSIIGALLGGNDQPARPSITTITPSTTATGHRASTSTPTRAPTPSHTPTVQQASRTPTATATPSRSPAPTHTLIPQRLASPAPALAPGGLSGGVRRGPPSAAASTCPCDQGDILNCSDFDAWDAQACYLRCKQLTGQDIHRLDRDGDGNACEWGK